MMNGDWLTAGSLNNQLLTTRVTGWSALLTIVFALILGLALPAHAQTVEQQIQADMEFLAGDVTEGRGTGQRGYDVAVAYVASRFRAAGLAPLPALDGWQQHFELTRFTLAEGSDPSLRIDGKGRSATQLFDAADVAPYMTGASGDVTLAGKTVFVGYAIPGEHSAGPVPYRANVSGRIALVIDAVPAGISGDKAQFFGDRARRIAALKQQGATGVVFLRLVDEASPPGKGKATQSWAQAKASVARGVTRANAGTTIPAALASAAVSRELLGVPGGTGDEGLIWESVLNHKHSAKSLHLTYSVAHDTMSSSNVLAMLPGQDNRRCVVLMSHLDHLGRQDDPEGTQLFPGAIDNASGVSILLDVARRMAAEASMPRRCVVFAALGAEELGLVGADFLAKRQPELNMEFAASVNMDGPFLYGSTSDITVLLDSYSTMSSIIDAVARENDFARSLSPLGPVSLLARSDHYPFFKSGVPSIVLTTGLTTHDPEIDMSAMVRDYVTSRYHRPEDDLSQPIDYASAAQFSGRVAAILRAIADSPGELRFVDEGKMFEAK